MDENRKVNTALAIMGFAGGLVIYSAIDKSFTVPEPVWGLATAASVYFFSTAGRGKKSKNGDDEDES